MNGTDHKALNALVNLPASLKVYNWLRQLGSMIYPARCLLCGAAGTDQRDICDGCARDLPWNNCACRQCALPLPATTTADLCGQCLTNPPPFESGLAALRYTTLSGWLISGLKFRGQLSHARLLGTLLAEHIQASGQPLPELVLPVPLHPTRLRERGYNQAVELARPVAHQFKLPLDLTTVQRVRPTTAQSELRLKARRRNMHGAFRAHTALDGASVAIIDDVVTSTSTVRELATTLRKAGAGRISVWSLARAPLPGQH